MLPTLSYQKISIHLPSSNQDILIRPFTAGEDKIFLNLYEKAKKEGDDFKMKDFVTALVQIFENCTFGKVDILNLPVHDIEWLLLKLREASRGEEINVKIPCVHCEHGNLVEYSTKDFVEPKTHADFKDLILLDEEQNIYVKMMHPKFKLFEPLLSSQDNLELFCECVESVIQGDEVFYFDSPTVSKKEKEDFILSMQKKHIDLLEKHFFGVLPKPSLDIEFKCSSCGKDNKYRVEGLLSFFS